MSVYTYHEFTTADGSRHGVYVPQGMSAAQAKREGLNDQIRELLNSSLTIEELDTKWQMVEDDHLPVLPLSWMDAVRDIYENKREELNNVG